MRTKRMWAGAAVAVCVLVVAPAWGHPHPDERELNLEEIIAGLEQGMVALEQLDRERELEMLRRVAEGVRQRARGNRVENRLATGQPSAVRSISPRPRPRARRRSISSTCPAGADPGQAVRATEACDWRGPSQVLVGRRRQTPTRPSKTRSQAPATPRPRAQPQPQPQPTAEKQGLCAARTAFSKAP